MPGPFKTLSVRGDRWPENRRMHVTLYPNTPAERAACTAGSTIARALEHAAEQLLDAGAISYCRVMRFPAEQRDYEYPRVDAGDLGGGFTDYLAGTTDRFSDASWCSEGDCGDLRDYRGVHLLVHGYGFSTDLADAEAIDCERNGGSGFSRGTAAWTSADDGSGAGMTRNSAIHETLHCYIRPGEDAVGRLVCDLDGDGETTSYEEHTVGAIDSTGAATPMLTYHVDEHSGCHRPDRTWNGEYTQALTEQTKAAVYHTGLNQCHPQPGVPEYTGNR